MPVPTTAGRDVARPVEITPQRFDVIQRLAGKPSGARQRHGFTFEAGLTRLLNYSPADSYTAPVDAWETVGANYPVSFKNIKDRAAIELGSASRNAAVERDFLFYVGFWSGLQRATTRIHVMVCDSAMWRSWFPDDMDPFSAEAVFDGITNAYADDAAWKVRCRQLRALWKQQVPDSPIQVRFKRDHKSQKRVQCAIPFRSFKDVSAVAYSAQHTRQLETALDQQVAM